MRTLTEADVVKSFMEFATSAFFVKQARVTAIKELVCRAGWDRQLSSRSCRSVPRRIPGPFGRHVDLNLKERLKCLENGCYS